MKNRGPNLLWRYIVIIFSQLFTGVFVKVSKEGNQDYLECEGTDPENTEKKGRLKVHDVFRTSSEIKLGRVKRYAM